MRKLLIILGIFFIVLPINTWAVDNYESGYAIDNANILSSETLEYINDKSLFLKKKYKMDYVVLTIKDINDYELEEYADLAYDYYEIKSNGILILVDYKDKMLRVKVGEALSSNITSEIIDKYINLYFMPFLKKKEWDNGIRNGYSAFYKLLSEIYGFNASEVVVYDDVSFISKYKDVFFLLVAWLNTIVAYVFCNYFINVYKNSKFDIKDSILFGVILLINILLLVFIYSIDVIGSLFIFIIELGAIYSNIVSSNKISPKKINKTSKNNDNVCYNKKQGGKHEKKRSR